MKEYLKGEIFYKLSKSLLRVLEIIFLLLVITNCSSENRSARSIQASDCIVGIALTSDCTAKVNQVVTATTGTTVTNWTNPTEITTVTSSVPDGYYQNQFCSLSDNDLVPGNIKLGVDVFGVIGNYVGTYRTSMASQAPRDSGKKVIANFADFVSTSKQLNLHTEVTTFVGADFPSGVDTNYRDIPDMKMDDDGTLGITCEYAKRPTINCGMTQSSLEDRIADCKSANPTAHSWDGSLVCNSGQGLWKLVVRSAANNEVWQDQRTGLLWSSVVGTDNWCSATGNVLLGPLVFVNSYNTAAGTPITGNGTIGALTSGTSSNTEIITVTFTNSTTFTVTGAAGAGGCQGGSVTGALTGVPGSTATYSDAGECSFTLTQGTINFAANDTIRLYSIANTTYSCLPGGPLQPAAPISYCAESASLNPPAGDDWLTPNYISAKGKMGKNSTPSVRWRLPTTTDFKQADINGIRFVFPDMGLSGSNRPSPDGSLGGQNSNWVHTTRSTAPSSAQIFYTSSGNFASSTKNGTNHIRCVGR